MDSIGGMKWFPHGIPCKVCPRLRLSAQGYGSARRFRTLLPGIPPAPRHFHLPMSRIGRIVAAAMALQALFSAICANNGCRIGTETEKMIKFAR